MERGREPDSWFYKAALPSKLSINTSLCWAANTAHSPPCLFKARKEGRARTFYQERKHINDSCEQLLIFLTYNFLITVNQNNLHDNILKPLLASGVSQFELGDQRVCLINNQGNLTPSFWPDRQDADWGYLRNNHLWHNGQKKKKELSSQVNSSGKSLGPFFFSLNSRRKLWLLWNLHKFTCILSEF